MIRKWLFYCLGLIRSIVPIHIRNGVARQLKRLAKHLEFDNVVLNNVKQAVVASNQQDYDIAEELLMQSAIDNPNNPMIAPHLRRVRFLRSRASDDVAQKQKQDMVATINKMSLEIQSQSIYVPGEFWGTIGKFHLEMLKVYGVENFKRTVSHHYQNWFMVSPSDTQVKQLLKLWHTHRSIQPWFNNIEIPDHVGFSLTRDFSDPTYPLTANDSREVYRVAVGMLWEYVNHTDSDKVLPKVVESEIGNPLRIWRKGKLISSDIAHSVRERNLLLKTLSLKGTEGLVIGELGAGHGRLAEIFGKTTNYRHLIFDITPALYVSQWYVKNLFPNEKIFEFRHFDDFEEIREELNDCRFAFFTSNQIEKIPSEYFDLFINLNSLAEMKLVQINNFIEHIDRVTSRAFLSRQQIDSINEVELTPLPKSAYAMPNRWHLILDDVDDIYPTYFNQIWEKG